MKVVRSNGDVVECTIEEYKALIGVDKVVVDKSVELTGRIRFLKAELRKELGIGKKEVEE